MNEPSDFVVDELSRQELLENLPVMVSSSRLTWNKITQSQWSETSFDKLYDVITDIASRSAMHGMHELNRQAIVIQQFFDSFYNTRNIPSSTQAEEINQLFDLLEQALAITLEEYSSAEAQQNRCLFFLHGKIPLLAEVASLLEQQNFEVFNFEDIETLLENLAVNPPAMIIVETGQLPAIASLKEEISSLWSLIGGPVPLVFISNQDDIKIRLAAMQAGASRYFSPPHDTRQISAEIINLATPAEKQQDKVLIIEDDPTQAEFAASILDKAGMLTATVTHPMDVMNTLRDFRPDIILMDIYMPDANGMELTTIIRDDLRYITTPIIFLSGETDPDKQIDALTLGGDDFISKPIRPKFLIATIKNRIKRTRDLVSAITLQSGETIGLDSEMAAAAGQNNFDADLLAEESGFTAKDDTTGFPSEDEILRDKLQQALEAGQFKNYFQPILSVHDKDYDNYSLLVTMNNNGTIVHWQQISSIAKKYGLQQNLDQCSVEQGLDAIHELINEGKKGTIFVPQSVMAITNDIEPEWLRSTLRARQMVGTSLVLEYNLHELASNIKASKAYISQLHEMGIKTCMTSFPAKKAAFKLLNFLDVDYIKVSEKLLETDNDIINAFIHRAHKLRASVIVANISDPRHINLHWTSNADYIQGDFVSPASESMNFNFSQAAL